LPYEECLQLGLSLNLALGHLHRNGLLHRDIKPSNIIFVHGIPKLADIGLVTEAAEARSYVGTEGFIPPEGPNSRQADIYSLGKVLYEISMGKDRTDFPEPFTALGTAPESEALLELNAVILKACATDLRERYRSAEDMHVDLALLQSGKSVRQTRRLERRLMLLTRVGITAVAAGALALGAFFYQQKQTRRALQISENEVKLRQQAESERQRAVAAETLAKTEASKSQQVAQFLKDMLQGVGPSVALGRDTTMLREILDSTAGHVRNDLTNQPEVAAELLSTLGTVYNDLGQYAQAEGMHREALAMRKKLVGDTQPDVATSLQGLARALQYQGKRVEAETLYREALAMRRKILGNEHPEVAKSLTDLGLLLYWETKFPEAETMGREALAMKRKLLGDEHLEVARSLAVLAPLVKDMGKGAEAETMQREALAIQKKILGNEHPSIAYSLYNLSAVLEGQGKLAEAEAAQREALALYRKLLGDDHPNVAESLIALGILLRRQSSVTEAEAAYREAIAIARKRYPDASETLSLAVINFVDLLLEQHRRAEAQKLFDELLTLGAENQAASASLIRVRAIFYARAGQWKKAAADAAKALEFGPMEHEVHGMLAPLLAASANNEGYLRHCRLLLASFGETSDPRIAGMMALNCLILPSPEVDLNAVARLAGTAVSAPTNHPRMKPFQVVKGLAEYRQGRFSSSAEWMQKVLARPGARSLRDVQAYMVLAMAQYQLKQPDEARTTLANGRETARAKLPPLESGDIGADWDDWIIAHALLNEAEALVEGGAKPAKQPN